MASVTFGDELIRDYLVYRGFLTALKSFDSEVKADKDRGFRPDRIVEHLSSCITNLDLNALREAWSHLEQRVFSRLEHSFLSTSRKLENALLQMYLVTCISASRHDKLTDFFEKMTPELQSQSEWREWFALPFLKNPDENPTFATYFTRQWQDKMIVSLHNFISVVFQSIATPSILSYEEELLRLNTLQEENDALKSKLSSLQDGECLRNLTESGTFDTPPPPAELIDDFHVIAQETPTENAARSIKTLIKNFGSGLPSSPVLGRQLHEGRRQDDYSPSGGGKQARIKTRSPSVPPQLSSQMSRTESSHISKQDMVHRTMSIAKMRPVGPLPWLRENWNSLNRGQQLYTVRQYNLALQRRGQQSVSFPGLSEAATTSSSPSFHSPSISYQSTEVDAAPLSNTQEQDQISTSSSRSCNRGSDMPPSPVLPGTASQSSDSGGDPPPLKKKRRKDTPGSSLPGTGRGIDADGNIDEPIDSIPRPFSIAEGTTMSFRKVHSFFTYGIGHTIISKNSSNWVGSGDDIPINYFLTTSLAEVPWDRLFMYLNPSEFANIPQGAFVEKCSIQIKTHNVRMAFATNALSSNLATLNQNKNLISAVGLNINIDGLNCRYTAFSAADPMLPSDLLPNEGSAGYSHELVQFYGVGHTNVNFTTTIPANQVGKPYQLRHYFCMTANNKDKTSGWECLQAHLNEFEADATSGKIILSQKYHPIMAPINKPFKSIYTGYPCPIAPNTRTKAQHASVLMGSKMHYSVAHKKYMWNTSVNKSLDSIVNVPEVVDSIKNDSGLTFGLTSLIEKSQFISPQSVEQPSSISIQPSIHVGVKPCYALSTANSINSVLKHTDTQGYFKATCDLVVKIGFPCRRPLPTKAHVKFR